MTTTTEHEATDIEPHSRRDGHPLTTKTVTTWLPTIMVLCGLIGTAAVTFSQVGELRTAQAETTKRVEQHVSSSGHQELVLKEQVLEAAQVQFQKMLEAHEREDKSRDARLDRVDINVLLVCQATRGAQCQRP